MLKISYLGTELDLADIQDGGVYLVTKGAGIYQDNEILLARNQSMTKGRYVCLYGYESKDGWEVTVKNRYFGKKAKIQEVEVSVI